MAGLIGPRLVRVSNVPAQWALKAVMLNGVDVTDQPLVFGARESLTDLEIVLTDRVAELSGTVTDARKRRVSNAPVVVFPKDRALWAPASRFVTMTRTGRDGAFTIRQLPPGEYLAASVDRLVEGEWQDPNLLESLVRSAREVALQAGQNQTVSLQTVVR